MNQWLEYKIRKKLRRRLARAASMAIRAGRRLRLALGMSPGHPFVTSRYGVLMRANWEDRTFQYCHFGVYGRVLSDYLAGIGEDFVFLDIGANQGLYTLLAARNPRCVMAVALEPVPATFELLRQNVEANGIADRVKLVRAALAASPGTAEIAVQPGHSGVATLAQGADRKASAGVTQTVELIDAAGLDAYLPGATSIVVKVDVEGYEKVVLAELMRSTNASRMRTVFYEVDTRWSDAAGLRALLEAGGFTSFERFGRTRHYDVMATRGATPTRT